MQQHQLCVLKPQGNTTFSSDFNFGPTKQLPSSVVYATTANSDTHLALRVRGFFTVGQFAVRKKVCFG